MRIKLDENLGARRAVELLRSADHDVATVPDQRLQAASDVGLAEVCRAEDRCLVTLDLGFSVAYTLQPWQVFLTVLSGWINRHQQAAIGKYGSLAVIERYIRSLKDECTRLLPIVPLVQAAFGRELDHFVAWYNAERPHSRFVAPWALPSPRRQRVPPARCVGKLRAPVASCDLKTLEPR